MNVSPPEPLTLHRFFLFGGDAYYAAGGFHDFVESYPDRDLALREARDGDLEWWHIYDSVGRTMTDRSRWQAHGATNEIPQLPTPTEEE